MALGFLPKQLLNVLEEPRLESQLSVPQKDQFAPRFWVFGTLEQLEGSYELGVLHDFEFLGIHFLGLFLHFLGLLLLHLDFFFDVDFPGKGLLPGLFEQIEEVSPNYFVHGLFGPLRKQLLQELIIIL